MSDYLIGNYENKTIGKRKRVVNLDTGKVYESSVEASKETNCSPRHIREVCRGERKRTGGYHWAYQEDYLQKEQEKATKMDNQQPSS